ncbi:hypothetical protein MJ579_04655 [Klebsiella pneumoniae]|nr:hypothetical protein MJ579_04655 [Klebsiella pneumoniae]
MPFESKFEGLIAFIDLIAQITAINQTARRLLNLSQPNRRLSANGSAALSRRRSSTTATDQHQKDEIVTFNQIKVIASRMAVI